MKRITIEELRIKKRQGKKIVMLTAYDYSMAKIVDAAGVDIILVGDSLANVVLGLDSTNDVTTEQMLYHAKAVTRAVTQALVVGDMPFEAYQARPKDAVKNAKRFITEAGCQAVKIEWFDDCIGVTKRIVTSGIPVMGHVGLTPQTAAALGGFKVQGKDAESAQKIIAQALAFQKVGCFAIVLECIPDKIAQQITKALKIPTIGIGAGVYCDGQVLVMHDLLGLFDRFRPKFVKTYAHLTSTIRQAVVAYAKDVRAKKFPTRKQSFTIKPEELRKLKTNRS
jgi:3-methyl-2-oxobutanoate hydroxymethyltransferase